MGMARSEGITTAQLSVIGCGEEEESKMTPSSPLGQLRTWIVAPFLGAKEQRRKNKFAEEVMHSVLQVNRGSCKITKLRYQETRNGCLSGTQEAVRDWICRLACCLFISSAWS